MYTQEQLDAARRHYVLHYGIPDRHPARALNSDYHTLAEELSLAAVGITVPRGRIRSLCEQGHKI